MDWELPPRSVAALRRRLLTWFDAERRPLPWRDVDDPYKVWISEIMLQQTRVDTVWPYYERWLKRFPTVESLAGAPLDEVLGSWSGLGYYSRARNLQKAARIIVEHHEGRLPQELEDLLGLPGVGPYSAGAIASIAYRRAVPAVDGNALRVLSRLSGDRGDITGTATKRRLTEMATRLVDPARPGEWNQAIMELGATLCRPRDPLCGECPANRWCRAHRDGLTHLIPKTRKKAPAPSEALHFAFVEKEGAVLLYKREEGGLLGGTWGLPGGPVVTPLSRCVREQTGLRVRKGRHLGVTEHRFTHKRWVMQVYRCSLMDGTIPRGKGPKGEVPGSTGVWVQRDELADAPLAKATRKALDVAFRRVSVGLSG